MKLTPKIVLVVLIILLFDSVLEIWSGSLDITSYIIGAIESFFTLPYGVLYSDAEKSCFTDQQYLKISTLQL